MILTIFKSIAIIVLLISQNSCGFRLYDSKTKMNSVSLNKLESPCNSYVSNKIVRSLLDNNINFSKNSPYILKINHEEFRTSIISTNSNSLIREIELSIFVEYSVIKNKSQVIFTDSYTEKTIVTLDNVNMNIATNQLEPEKIKLAEIVAEQILGSLSTKKSQIE